MYYEIYGKEANRRSIADNLEYLGNVYHRKANYYESN